MGTGLRDAAGLTTRFQAWAWALKQVSYADARRRAAEGSLKISIPIGLNNDNHFSSPYMPTTLAALTRSGCFKTSGQSTNQRPVVRYKLFGLYTVLAG
jgi:hypothetical protein